ncbi:long-chain fatty acid--CoA ligase [Glaciibacter psychrotolerans]
MLGGARVVGDVLDVAAQRHGTQTAVQDSTGSLTFVELRDRARRLADGLLRSGLLPGDRVLEALPNSCDLLVSEMALALAGLVRVPLNPRLGPSEWRGIRQDCGARGLIVDAGLRGADGVAITDVIACERVFRADAGDLDGLIATGSATAVLPQAQPGDTVGLAYSSGTTGLPKGAIRTHAMRLAAAQAMLREVIAPTGAVGAYLHAGPAIHTSGLFILPMLALGARQVMAHHPDPERIAALIAGEQITHLALVPSVLEALTHLPLGDRAAFDHVRMLASAGAPMPPAQIRRVAERLTDRLVQYYGLVEAIPPLSVLSIDDHARGLRDEPRLLASAGRIVAEARIEISAGAGLGEVVVSGPMVAAGYWNAAERADLGKAFEGAALATGDIGSIFEGYLFLTDRTNNMLISGGYNIYPSEVEEAVALCPGLREVVVVGIPDERWGERITLVYTTMSGRDLDAMQRRALRTSLDALSRHKRPKSLHRLAEFPLGATGKIDRRAVVAHFIAAERTGAEHQAPDSPHERFLTT